MTSEQTTIVIQQYLDNLADLDSHSKADPIIRELMARSVDRLQLLCRNMLVTRYPRLMQPPLNLQVEEMLSSVVERLIKAMREVRPGSVRQFFALANQHIRWELNEVVRQLDKQAPSSEFDADHLPAADPSDSQLTAGALRILQAIDELPDDEREVFSLVRIQGLPQIEVAEILEVSPKTIQRRLNRALVILTTTLRDLASGNSPG